MKEAANFALLLDKEARIKEVIYGPKELFLDAETTHLIHFIDKGSIKRFMSYINETLERGYSLGGEIVFSIKEDYIISTVSFIQVREDVVLVSLIEQKETLEIIKEIIEINNRQTNEIRRSYSLSEIVGEDKAAMFYEEMTALNNELINMQRNIGQKNSELERLNALLKESSYTDYLTKIGNRRQFFEDAETMEIIENVALHLLDINHFKKANDVHGHHFGDKVLFEFAQALEESAKELNGRAYRLGGDEFALITPVISKDVFAAQKKKLNKLLKSYGIGLSVAHGMIECNATKEDRKTRIKEALVKADILLYEDKKNIKG